MKFLPRILLLVPFFLTACASIVDHGPKTVRLNTNPEGAKVTIFNSTGQEVTNQITPASVALKRSSGFAGEVSYKLLFEKEGYHPQEAQVKSTINGWYFGNIVFGGLIGCVVDMGTGSCYTLSPSQMTYNLIPANVVMTQEELKLAQAQANPKKKPALQSRK